MKISNHSTPRPLSGFTLIEIITVIAIIMVLAAMTIGGMGYYQDKLKMSRTKIFIGTLESAIEDYSSDNSEYPSEGADGSDSSSEILYKTLYGVEDGLGDVPDDGATVYLSTLDPRAKKNNLNVTSDGGGVYYLVDSFTNKSGDRGRIRYYHSPTDSPTAPSNGNYENPINPPASSFDLWSMGKDSSDQADDQKDDITNWK